MIAIKNADGTLVPLIDSSPGANRSVALSLVHSHQKRAEILLYELQGYMDSPHIRDLDQPEPFGKLVLRHLPDNPFGEVEIRANLSIDSDMRLHLSAEAEGEKPVKGNFRIPSAGLGPDERHDQMSPPIESEGNVESDNGAAAVYSDDLFDPNFESDFLLEEEVLPAPELEVGTLESMLPSPESEDLMSEVTERPEIAFDPDADLPPLAEDIAPDVMPNLESETLPDGFLNDPEDMDWGFDELANPSDAEAIQDDINVLDASSSTPDAIIGVNSPAMASIPGLAEPASNRSLPVGPNLEQNAESSSKPSKKAKPEPKFKAEKLPAPNRLKPNLGQKLLRASAVLFVISLIEIGLFFLLRLHLI